MCPQPYYADTMLRRAPTSAKGFTLIEMLVSVAIFSIVMTIALGSLLAMSESDRKAQTLKSVINNLNFALDSMSRSIRTGINYHCDMSQGVATSPRDCASTAGTSFSFLSAEGETVMYRLQNQGSDRTVCGQPAGSVGCIARSTDNGVTFSAITSPEVVVSSMSFYVTGAESVGVQPKVTILLSGSVQSSGTGQTPFFLQTSVTQRLYDQ